MSPNCGFTCTVSFGEPHTMQIVHAIIYAKLRLYGRKQNDYVWSEIHIITYFDEHLPTAAFGNIHNIQAQKLWQERIEQEASHDKLTGLLNKDATQTQIGTALAALYRLSMIRRPCCSSMPMVSKISMIPLAIFLVMQY